MIKKFVTLKNVGRFKSYGAIGDVELKRYSLVYAENGRGKTTLCAVLRSLQTGQADHVLGRRTLGSADAPEVRIIVDGGVRTLTAGTWNAPLPEITIFDATFVSENVFSGDLVGISHRRNLYRVIVGKDGVTLAKEIEQLDDASRLKATDIREKAAPLYALLPRGTTLEAFLDIKKDPEIEDKVRAADAELEAVRQAEQIRARASLVTITVPSLPPGFADLLGRTVDGIAQDAEATVNAHVAAHAMGGRGQGWLSEGVGYVGNEACPFCNQSLAPAGGLLSAYRAVFSQGYQDLRRAIGAMRTNVESVLGDRQIATFERTFDQNVASAEFWTRFCELVVPAPIGGAGDKLRTLRLTALELLDRKAATPLESIVAGDAFSAAVDDVTAIVAATAPYNEAILAGNRVIAARKAATGATDIRTAEAALSRVQLAKSRHEAETGLACDAYQAAVSEKAEIEEKKNAIKKKLDEHTRAVLGRYEHSLNRLLADFHAGFRIAKTEHGYPGGVASSSYQIVINEVPVELGDSDTPLDRPSFKNTLSAGDKSTLALAFFLAQLEHDPDRATKIVVFDDPFNSQDAFRKDHTVRKIRDTGEACAQVIVFSHDLPFLKRIWDRLEDKTADRKCLELKRIGLQNTSIVAWDIEAASQSAFKADRQALADYYHDGSGDPRAVVQKIRPVLETWTKVLGGGAIAEADTLGVIVGKIRAVGPAHQLFPICDGLDDLNVYTRRYHHGDNPNAATEPITDGELQVFVRRTLEMTGGC